ncbi:MAG TPA: KTSC domain-containing protein [Bryobacteraceae bacterium]|nr:KTSC domain-containing protein [Bryobacteraceae bacterium]
MTMDPVQSSNVAEIGWESDKLTVRFRDGAEYEYPGVTERQYKDLMAAPSKGRALNGLIALRAGVTLKSAKKPEVAAGGPIHTSQAEGCCARRLNKASLSGKLDSLTPFECPKCGTVYSPKACGPLVNWEASADIIVFRL